MLKLRIRQKNIEIEQEAEYNRGTVGAKVNIIFDDFWTDFEKTVVFKRCYDALSEPINVIVNDMDTTIDIPPEILVESGKFRIGVFGIKDNVVWPTLYSKEFDSRYATDTKGKSPNTYTPSEIEQLKVLKQDKLTAGDGIVIEDNVISVSGGADSGGETWRTIQHLTLTEDTNSIIFSADSEGKPFNLKKARLIIKGTATHTRLNTYINKYVNVYFYSSLAANAASNYIYEIGEVTNALRVVTLIRTTDENNYLLADGQVSFKPVVTKNKYGENTPISHLKIELNSGQYFLSGTEFIFEGVDEE